LCYTFSLHFL